MDGHSAWEIVSKHTTIKNGLWGSLVILIILKKFSFSYLKIIENIICKKDFSMVLFAKHFSGSWYATKSKNSNFKRSSILG